jgi:hypothetical protein
MKRCPIGSWRPGERAGRSPWRRAAMRVTTALAAAALALPLLAAAPAPTAASGGPRRLQVLVPRPGAVVVEPSALAARKLRLGARVRVGGPVQDLSVQLNGHLAARLASSSGVQRVLLDRQGGLTLGENLLWVTVRFRGASQPSVVPVRFFVGYRATGLLSAGIRLGAGTGPAAVAGVRVPGTGVDRLIATLNGRPINLPPVVGNGARRELDLAQLGALRFGTNRLQVRLLMENGAVQVANQIFTLNPGRDVAVAGLDGQATVGHVATLDAGRSLLVPGSAPASQARWVLLRRPLGSHASLGVSQGIQITLRPDVPGDYQVALFVGHGARTGMDLLTVSATDPEPLVPLNTIKYQDGKAGVQVGNNFYPDSEKPSPAPVQVLVLDRSNLGLRLNLPYDGSAGAFLQLSHLLQGLPSTDLVIITHPGHTGELPSNSLPSLDDALHKIGGSLPAKWTLSRGDCWSGATNNCTWVHKDHRGRYHHETASWQRGDFDDGSFSVIGVPGLAVGQAWRETAVQVGSQNGRIDGYLTPGTAITGGTRYYTVVNGGADQYVPVNTCAPPNFPGGCVVRIGDKSYPPVAGASGLQVVEVDRTTLTPIVNRTVNTAAGLLSALTSPGGQQRVGHVVGSMSDQRLVIIRSVGDGYVSGISGAQAPLLQYIDELGGTPDLLLGTMTGHYKYALVGAATNLPWRNPSALESSSQIPVIPNSQQRETGQISGVLERDRDGLYAPLAGDPISSTNVDLLRILYQPAQPWPYAEDTQELRYIADHIGLPGYPDVRSAYENLLLPWPSLEGKLYRLTCTDPSLCGANFAVVKQQLEMEIGWVQTVHNLAARLLTPYQQVGSNPYFNVQQVTDEVMNSVPVPSSSTVTMKWLNILTGVSGVGSALAAVGPPPAASAVFGLIGSAGELATAFMMQPNSKGGPADAVTTTAQLLAHKLADQQTAYIQWINQMEEILLYDYGKLQAVGTAVGSNPAWHWTPRTNTDSITALQAGTRASAYSALLPVAWQGYNLKPDMKSQFFSNDVRTLKCNPGNTVNNYPFANALPQNQFHAITTLAGDGGRVDQSWVLAKLNLGDWAPASLVVRRAQLPTTSLTDKIYGTQAAGPNGAFQYEPVWWRDTYNPPSHTICSAWNGSASGLDPSTAFAPPNIVAPPP